MANTLQTIIPEIVIPQVPVLRQPPSQPSTAPYAPINGPPQCHVPYWILHDPTLADKMMERLRAYLPTAQGSTMSPSTRLQLRLTDLQNSMFQTPARELRSEATTSLFWLSDLFPIIGSSVSEVDQNPTLPAMDLSTLYDQSLDGVIRPTEDASPRLHLEYKNWWVFDTFAPEILMLAQHVEGGQLGTSLELGNLEVDARSIIMKMGVSMIGGPTPIPYGLLFGGDKFMFFSLFLNENTVGEVRYGLACSDIISSTNAATPLIPLTIYTLLGNTDKLFQPTFTIPPIPTPVIQDPKPETRRRLKNFQTLTKKTILKIRPSIASGAVSRSLLLHREPDVFESDSSPAGPLMPSFTQPLTAYVGTTPFSSTVLTPAIDRITPTVEDPLQSNASLDPLDDQIEILLTECIGHGASGQVFIGLTDGEKYAVKIVSSRNGKQMLQQEAEIYDILSDLQGQCIPKIYGFFGSEHFKALVMAYMGHSVENVSDLSIHQRHQLLEELCLIHEHGVLHADLRAPNIVLQNGSAHFIDFSHGREHECTGRTTCFELIYARRILMLNLEQPAVVAAGTSMSGITSRPM